MRTMDESAVPGEHVVAEALRAELPDYLLHARPAALLRKTIGDNIDPDLAPRWLKLRRLAA